MTSLTAAHPDDGPLTPSQPASSADVSSAEDRAQDASTLARSGALNLVGMGLYGALNFVLVIIVTRQLGAAGGGAFLEAVALYSILSKSAVLGADLGLLRYVSRLRGLRRTHEIASTFRVALVPVAVIGTVFGVAVFLAASPLSRLLSHGVGRSDLTTYLRVMAPFVPVGAVYLALESATRGFGTMVPSVAIERIGRPALQPVLMLAALAAGLGSAAIALSWIAPTVVALVPMAVWTVVLVRRVEASNAEAGAQHTTEHTPHLAREFWRFSSPRALGGVFQVAIIWLDALLIGALASTREAGIYTATTRWLIVGSFAGLAITQAVGHQISFVLARRERARAKHLFAVSTGWLILVSFPAYLTVMVFAPLLLQAFGHGFGEGVDALVILGAANLFAGACGAVDVVLQMAGKSSLSLADNAVALAANIVLNLVLVPRYGIVGAAAAWAVSLVITNAAPLVQVWRAEGLHPFSAGWVYAVALPLGAVGAVEVGFRALFGATLPALAGALVLAGTLYAAGLLWFRDRLDLDQFANALTAGVRRASGEPNGGSSPHRHGVRRRLPPVRMNRRAR